MMKLPETEYEKGLREGGAYGNIAREAIASRERIARLEADQKYYMGLAEKHAFELAQRADDLKATLAEREKEIERLKLVQKTVIDIARDLRSRLATARAFIRTLWELGTFGQACASALSEDAELRAALAATEEGKEDHVGTDCTAD